jgi:hypothetical protein
VAAAPWRKPTKSQPVHIPTCVALILVIILTIVSAEATPPRDTMAAAAAMAAEAAPLRQQVVFSGYMTKRGRFRKVNPSPPSRPARKASRCVTAGSLELEAALL